MTWKEIFTANNELKKWNKNCNYEYAKTILIHAFFTKIEIHTFYIDLKITHNTRWPKANSKVLKTKD